MKWHHLDSHCKHHRVGHVFQDRYKAILVQKESHLLELARYVVLNPVRASMVSDTADWLWSSYSVMAGKRPPPRWLETDWLLSQFGSSRQAAIEHYINNVRAGVGLSPIWQALKHQVYLGDVSFMEEVQMKMKGDGDKTYNVKESPRVQRRAIAKPLGWYEQYAGNREQGIVKAYLSGD